MTAPGTTPRARVTRYTVNCMPDDATPDARLWAIHIDLQLGGVWSITNGWEYLDADGLWHQTRREAGTHTIGAALRLANAAAPLVTVNGFTPARALERIARINAKEQTDA